ncbi:hypothetical protein [Pseudomonas parasichuanensis]|uniref:hypothetical protein n=1 Tax=Pseudomonas parasichuanensis TaxID=2892329 RepID=UPI001F15F4D5|nr:hypothetical protein [Pseudomonas parasichuanensis]
MQMVDAIAHSCLDFPQDRQLCAGPVTISGWLLPTEEAQRASLVIRTGKNKVVRKLNIERADVLCAILDVAEAGHHGHAQLKCGFSFEVDMQFGVPTELSLQLNGVEHPWKVIHCQPSGIDASVVGGLWSAYCHGKVLDADAHALVDQLDRLNDSMLRALLFEQLDEYLAEDILAGADAPGLERCRGFLQYVSREEFCIDAVQSATTKGAIIVPDPFGYGMAFADESYLFTDEINVLKFISSTGEMFFLFQHVGSADTIYFPTRRAMVTIHHVDAVLVRNFVYRFIRNLERVTHYSAGQRRFLGVIASHARPYHFYYDVAAAMSDLNEAGVLKDVAQIIYYPGGDFCSFKSLYALEATEQRLAPDELWAQSVAEQGFYFHVGMVFDNSRLKSTSRFDGEFNAYSRKQLIQQQPSAPAQLLTCYPLVWFGITVQKRAWIEQVEAAASLLTALQKTYPDVGVVFDGWTSPLHPTARDLEETAQDNRVVEQIVAQLDPGIKVFSVVGADSVQKIFYGKCADVYVGNSATGGLHVARFAGCPGVAHLNTQMIDADNHIRKRTRLVDKSLIIDQPDAADRRMDFISYSLDWRVVYDEVRDILQGVSV